MIRNAEKAKTPVMCVVGAKEKESGAALLWPCLLERLQNHRHDHRVSSPFLLLLDKLPRAHPPICPIAYMQCLLEVLLCTCISLYVLFLEVSCMVVVQALWQ